VGLLSTKHRPCDTAVIITTAITDSSTIKTLQLRKLTLRCLGMVRLDNKLYDDN